MVSKIVASTSLWRVHGWIGKLVVYIENPDKTENPKYYEKTNMTDTQAQGLADVIEYATRANKTTAHTDNGASIIIRQFVSGINVSPITARDSMTRTKREFDKTGGVIAYHGYQSFAPGEATPETAHEIGVKLAQQLWGDRFQVLVATHLDKSSHLHNHFVINTVSHIDGKKFHRTNQDYRDMQKASDALCREYGLSVIEKPERGKSKHYAEWQAERNGHPTWRSLIKNDVDAAIRQSMTERQFWDNLRKMGYEIKSGKDISVKPPGKERFVRLQRNFGDDYTIERIRKRILTQTIPERRPTPMPPPPKKTRLIGTFHKAPRITGFRALYFQYMYRMGVLPKKREPNKNEPSQKQPHFLFREDIRFIRKISQESRLLAKQCIDTMEQLAEHKNNITAQMNQLCDERKNLRNRSRRISEDSNTGATKSEIGALSKRIGELRGEAKLCGDIEKRSLEMKDKLRNARETESADRKERTKNEPRRGCR